MRVVPVGGQTAPYYYISNAQPRLSYGRAAFDERFAYKFNVIYEIPFLKNEKGFAGQVLGGWTVSSFFQYYFGHPIDVHTALAKIRARDAAGNLILDQNGVPYNIGGDYNLDGTANDHPVYLGSSIGAAYSGANPADGIFRDLNRIGCGEAGVPATANYAASSGSCAATPSTLFGNPAYPTGATPFERFGTLGRDVFQGPAFAQMDANLSKNFKLTERINLKFSAQFQNVLNHPSFDCIDSNVSSTTFGKAQCLAQSGAGGQSLSGLGLPIARVGSLGLRLSF